MTSPTYLASISCVQSLFQKTQALTLRRAQRARLEGRGRLKRRTEHPSRWPFREPLRSLWNPELPFAQDKGEAFETGSETD
jgi:hypothetical protein